MITKLENQIREMRSNLKNIQKLKAKKMQSRLKAQLLEMEIESNSILQTLETTLKNRADLININEYEN